MSEHMIHVAAADENAAVLDTLLLAFAGDPCLRFVLDTPDKLLRGFHRFATGMGGAAVELGTAWLADDGAAAALWLPPGVTSDREAMLAVVGEMAREEKLPTLGEVGDLMAQYHPDEPHWYLAMIGVDPARQGRGWGSAILKESLKRCDEDGVIAYLESSNPKNVPLYERFGFEVMGFVQPGDFPGLYPMIRRPR
ncbi:N-acetyltransferase [Phenylobacterium sp.]|uniref:GNAT family N-acetyltransferase n=1 Tax=Phenylobacterium sp. TaxID=1871053 RepID=UPI0025EB9F8A|nr:GNAT family N-acetyltransferase [Phenylobacterium sp.]MBX3485383.1 GNAT family N-acetyltransferase [Phenylobacterium sp.]MCW5758634.1 GNAT family N-acetyltransferase [Phenylobacterium sp.]